MEIQNLLNVMHLAEKIKNVPRHSFTSAQRQESVAEHSWRLALLAYFMKDAFPEADMNKVILMCLFHDFGEAFTGDIPSFYKKAEDAHTEEELLLTWCKSLPQPYGPELTHLITEMLDHSTLESRLCHALDGIEVVLQHNEADTDTWNDIEHQLLLVYGSERVTFSDYLISLRNALRAETLKKLQEDEDQSSPPTAITGQQS